MPRCRICKRYFKTQNGLNSHISMVKRKGTHYSNSGGQRRTYRRYRRY